MSFVAYLEQLRSNLRLKDPRRLTKAPRGAIILLLRDADGLHRASVVFDRDGATVTEGVADTDAMSLTIRAQLADWTAYFDGGEVARIDTIDFYGDTVLLRTWAELVAQELSPLALRVQRGRSGGGQHAD